MSELPTGAWQGLPPPRLSLISIGFLAVALMPLTAGAERAGPTVAKTDTVSSSQNRKTTQALPPPRTISDITAILDAQKLEQVERPRMKRYLKRANSKPPKNAGKTKLARFYLKRAIGARRVGRVRQTIDDLNKANALGADLPPKHRRKILQLLALAENSSGNRAKGIQYLRQALKVGKSEFHKVDDGARLTRFVVRFGNIEEAEKILAEATRRMNRMRHATEGRSAREWRQLGERLQGRIARAKGDILFETGRFAEAEDAFRAAINHYSRSMATSKQGAKSGRNLRNHARANLALVLSLMGRHKEGEVEARTALLDSLEFHGRYNRRTASRTRTLAEVLRAQGRTQEARILLRASLEIYGKIGTREGSRNTTNTRAVLADTLAYQGRWAEALEQFNAIKTASAHDPIRLEQRVLTNPSYALALIHNGRPLQALAIARRAVAHQLKIVGKDHPGTANVQGILAMALAALGRDREALVAFSLATPRLLTADYNQSHVERDWQTKLVLESHMTLLARLRGTALVSELGINPVAETFQIADTLHGQGVQRALNASAARASAGSPGLAKLVRREQDTANRIGALAALHAKLLSQPTDKQNAKARKSLPAAIARLRGEHNSLMAQTAKRFPAYAALIAPKPPTIAQARKSLGPKEALITTYVGESQSYVWAVRKSGPVAFAKVPMGRARMATMVKRLRQGLKFRGDSLANIPVFDVKTAHELYKALLEPIEQGWKQAQNLVVVADGPLGQLPFSLLVKGKTAIRDGNRALFSGYKDVEWLVRSHGVTSLPTVSAFITLRGLPSPPSDRLSFVGFADPWFTKAQAAEARQQTQLASARAREDEIRIVLRTAPKLSGMMSARLRDLPRLPETAAEVRSIAKALRAIPDRDVFTGRRFNEQQVKSMDLSRYQVVVFATHALVPRELDGLTQPALALTAPDIAGVAGDGLLTMDEVLGLKLDADWVVLSGCNTASGDGRGAEAISGLGRAFLYAGARALLITHWEIDSHVANVLVTDIFKRQAADPKLSPSQAMRRAKLAMIDGPGYRDTDGGSLFSYAHPVFWAPFALFGEGATSMSAM